MTRFFTNQSLDQPVYAPTSCTFEILEPSKILELKGLIFRGPGLCALIASGLTNVSLFY